MEIYDLIRMTGADREQAEKKMMSAIRHCSQVYLDEKATKEDLKDAANDALRAAGELLDLQKDTINALITISQELSAILNGSDPVRPS